MQTIFQSALINYTHANESEAQLVQHLLTQHPYSQLLHVLAARHAQDGLGEQAQERIQRAAVYVADRAVLKQCMEAPTQTRHELGTGAGTTATTEHEPEVKIAQESAVAAHAAAHDPGGPAHAPNASRTAPTLEEVLKDIDDMHAAMRKFEEQMVNLEKSPPPVPPPKPPKVPVKKTPTTLPSDGEPSPDQLIEAFIQSEPTISRPPLAQPPGEDLTESHSDFSDHIVSETLVAILLKQGKREKALDVLRKLIWKYPHKKAYFAAQIEELTGKK